MVLVRIGVDRLHLLRRVGNGLFHIAVLVPDECLLGVEPAFEELGDGGARELGVLAFVPGGGQRIERGLRLPPALGHNRNSAVADLHHVLDAGHVLYLGGVEAYELAAEHRAILDRRAQHAGEFQIEAVDLLTGEFGRGIEASERLAGNLPVLGIFERHVLRWLDPGGGFGNLAEGRGAAGGPMCDHAVRCAAFRCGDFPLVGGSRNQHGARGRAGLAYILVRFADGAASGRKLTAPHTVAREVLAGSWKFGRDLRPVAFQLLGHELGKARHRALPHLGAGDADHNAVVRLDHDPGRDLRGALRRTDDVGAEREVHAEGEPPAQRGRTYDEGAPIDLWNVGHGCLLPHAVAAAWIAARTCWNVPQRQMLVMALSMSASLGLGFSLSRAATAMIMPLWQ